MNERDFNSLKKLHAHKKFKFHITIPLDRLHSTILKLQRAFASKAENLNELPAALQSHSKLLYFTDYKSLWSTSPPPQPTPGNTVDLMRNIYGFHAVILKSQ